MSQLLFYALVFFGSGASLQEEVENSLNVCAYVLQDMINESLGL